MDRSRDGAERPIRDASCPSARRRWRWRGPGRPFALASPSGTRRLTDATAWLRPADEEAPVAAFSALDVDDVLRVLADLTSHAALAVALGAAADLLGHTVRDPALLRPLLRTLPVRHATAGDTVTIAM